MRLDRRVLGFVVIRLTHVTLRRGGRDVVRDVSGTFAAGSLTAITGPNGAGKSTLLHALCGLHPAAAGQIASPRDIALLPQEGQLDRAFPASCLEVVALGATARTGLFRHIGPNYIARAEAALTAVGLAGLGRRPIGALSAGQFQRVLFARTIVRDAPVILLDEPFSAVDAATEADLMAIVRAWHTEGRTVVAVLHDDALIRAAFPQTLVLSGRCLGWGPTQTVLGRRNLEEAA